MTLRNKSSQKQIFPFLSANCQAGLDRGKVYTKAIFSRYCSTFLYLWIFLNTIIEPVHEICNNVPF